MALVAGAFYLYIFFLFGVVYILCNSKLAVSMAS
jgi:hypothetical protein